LFINNFFCYGLAIAVNSRLQWVKSCLAKFCKEKSTKGTIIAIQEDEVLFKLQFYVDIKKIFTILFQTGLHYCKSRAKNKPSGV